MKPLLAIALLVAWSAPLVAADVQQMTIRPDASSALLVVRGALSLSTGDISAARRWLRKPAEDGIPLAAHLMGQSYDPVWLTKNGVLGVAWLADADLSLEWYRRAYELGDRSLGNWYADAKRETELELSHQH